MAYKPAVPGHPQTVVETPEFQAKARRLLSDDERIALIDHVAAHPDAGDPMPGTGGARKFRRALAGKGKRGGARVITFYSGPSIPVFLLSVFGKNEKADLTANERNELRQVLSELVETYRRGVTHHVQSRR